MKKRVLMPLMVASMMVASLVALDSCKKSEPQQSLPSIFETGEAPMVDTVIYGNRDLEYICPYCNASIPPNTTEHWHAFGTPCSGYSGPTPYAVDYCTSALSGSACPYSGIYEHDENAIAFMMSTFHIDREAAIARLKPRFHGHNLSYILSSGPNGGQHNAWHVGGGVPFWPCP